MMEIFSAPGLSVSIEAGCVARVVLNRPEVHNAFDEPLIAAITEAFARLDADEAVRVVVMSAVGRSFCAGADVAWMRRACAYDEAENLADAGRFAAMMRSIAQCCKPVIARVQGNAYGGGVGLVCAADIVIASEDARFAVSEARLGIVPAVIGPYLLQAVGARQARRLALSAELLTAVEARRIGLVHQVLAADAMDDALAACVDSLMHCGPRAQSEIKALFARLPVGDIGDAVIDLTTRTISRVRGGAEAREGFAAFTQKRPPDWAKW